MQQDMQRKQLQLNIILSINPCNDDYHTWIRTLEDIKTLDETLNDEDYLGYDNFTEDLTRKDLETAMMTGKIRVYSSYEIKNGTFVSPSYQIAKSYSGTGRVHSKLVDINDIAWIDVTEGMYAKVTS